MEKRALKAIARKIQQRMQGHDLRISLRPLGVLSWMSVITLLRLIHNICHNLPLSIFLVYSTVGVIPKKDWRGPQSFFWCDNDLKACFPRHSSSVMFSGFQCTILLYKVEAEKPALISSKHNMLIMTTLFLSFCVCPCCWYKVCLEKHGICLRGK